MKCLACSFESKDSKRFEYTPTTIDKLKVFDERSIICCKKCGFGKIEKDIDEDVLINYYSSDYSGKAKKMVQTSSGVFDYRTSFSFDIRSLSQLTLIRQYLDLNSDITVLEIGAGTGDFLFSLRQLNFNGSYIAFEPQEESQKCLEALGGNVEKVIFDKSGAAKYSDSVDLVIMSHSLEHFNPGKISEILGSVSTMLRDGGIFFCEVPNANLLNYPNAGERIVPHLTFFSEDSLRHFIGQAEMDLLFLSSCGNNQNEKDESKKITELEKMGHFIFDIDEENDILRNRSYHRFLESEKNRLLKKRNFLDIAFNLMGQKIIMKLINFLRKYRQNSHSSLLGSNYFSYGHDREFLRLIAHKKIK